MHTRKEKKSRYSFAAKAFAAVMAFLFLVFSSGLAVNVHYCAGRITSVKLAASHSCACGKSADTCCKDKTQLYKIDNSYTKSASAGSPAGYFKSMALVYNTLPVPAVSLARAVVFSSCAPPGGTEVPLYVSVCSYRI